MKSVYLNATETPFFGVTDRKIQTLVLTMTTCPDYLIPIGLITVLKFVEVYKI
jgi:hypothetical protein